MEGSLSFVNHQTCNKCLFCADVCPNMLIFKNDTNEVSFKDNFDEFCITCGHCMAVCPTGSIKIAGLDYENDFVENKNENIGFETFYNHVRNRRAIRQYKKKEVPVEDLQKIVEAIAMAPVGFTPNNLEVNVINSPELLKNSYPEFLKFYEWVIDKLSKPIPRFFIKKNVSHETFVSLDEHIYPLFTYKLPEIEGTDIDPIFRGAPAAIIIHANKDVSNYSEDGVIAMTYGFIAAHSLGLGTCPVSLIPPVLNKSEELKKQFKIPEDNVVVCSFILGYPKYKYKRTINRNMKNVVYVS